MHAGGFQAPPGRSRWLQGPPGAAGAEGKMLAAYCQSLEPWARLKFHTVEGGSAKGECPGAGCLDEY